MYGGEGGNYNLVNNYYKYGPSTTSSSRSKVVNPHKQTSAPTLSYAQIYLAGNYVDGYPAITAANWKGATMQGSTLADTTQSKALTPFSIAPQNTQTATAAYTSVLQSVGCVLPVRDAVDQRIIQEVQGRTGGIIDVQGGYPAHTPIATTQGAWPTLNCGLAPADLDHDGMTDAYETANSLNPNNAADRQAVAANGYTNLEKYLNGLVSAVTDSKPTGAIAEPLHLFPNPAAGQFTVEHPRSGTGARLTLYNLLGQQVTTMQAVADDTTTPMSLGSLAQGSYLLVYTAINVSLTARCTRE